jgi:hypothetical protein
MQQQINDNVDLITYEDDVFIINIEVKNEDGTDYSFSGATAEMKIDATRPSTITPDATWTTSGEITLTDGNIAIDVDHGVSVGKYFYDFIVTVSSKSFTLFSGKLTVRENV